MTLKLLALASLAAGMTWCQKDLADASLEQLLDTKVTTVSKKEQNLARTAAAVYVVTREDIERSGATNLPDLLRMVPGVNVAQIDGGSWAISIRGFNSRYSTNVLVLIDGRSVYSTAYSDVYWDQIDLPVAEIERIEVVRGPGGSVWGANAVNGVISIMTRNSKTAHGGSASLGSGSYTHASDTASYGGRIGSGGSYRVWGAYNDIADSVQPNGAAGGDGWERGHGGFRSDWSIGQRDSVTVEGDLYYNQAGHTVESLLGLPGGTISWRRQEAGGGSILGRWTRTADNGAEQSLQFYYSASHRTELGVPMKENSLDFNYQNRRRLGSRNEVVWGAGYRRTDTDFSPQSWVSFSPPARADALYSAFAEDEIRITNNLGLTLGTRVEHNPYTGFNVEPSARMAWTATPSSTFWLSAAHAVGQPGRVESGIDGAATESLGPGMAVIVSLLGNTHQRADSVDDYEAGYRAQINRYLSLDVAAFGSLYKGMVTIDTLPPSMVQEGGGYEPLLPYVFGNGGKAVNYGGEVSATWNATSRWRISPAYSMLHVNYRVNSASQVEVNPYLALCSPEYTWQVRSLLDLPAKLSFDTTVAWTSRLAGNEIPAHWRLDVRVARRLGESAEVSLVGQNLLQPRFLEFGNTYGIVATEFPRSIFGRVVFRF
jgi:iron complex outermembrane receptor protein